jgi:NAD(P)-dependent dehydrogenase (short-subunit alcohol dehydrogenase family)
MRADLFDLNGKVAVVTGGGRGIGAMIAKGLLTAGAKKVYLSSRKADELEAAVHALAEFGQVEAIPADLGTGEGVDTLARELTERETAIHVLFNNAGANWGSTFEDFPESGFDKVYAVNVKGVFLLTRALLPLLKAGSTPGDPARVINTGSVDGLRHARPWNQQLFLQRQQGRRAYADPAPGRRTLARRTGKCHRARTFRIEDDRVPAGRGGGWGG